jgi:hypothetical protein
MKLGPVFLFQKKKNLVSIKGSCTATINSEDSGLCLVHGFKFSLIASIMPSFLY